MRRGRLFAGVPSDADGARDFLWALIAGAYKKDPTTTQLLGQMLVAFIPVLGQLAAARDTTVYLYRLRQPNLTPPEKLENWIGVVLNVLVLVPEVGAAVAGVLRLAQRSGRVAERVPWARVLEVLNKLGRGNAFEFAAEHLTYEAVQGRAVQAFTALLGHLDACADAFARVLGAHPPLAFVPALAGVGRLRTELNALRQTGPAQVQGAVRALVLPIERAVTEARAHMLEREGAGGATNSRVEATAKTAHPPAPGGSRMRHSARGGSLGRTTSTRLSQEIPPKVVVLA